MKILMVTERYIPIWGGAENQLRQIIPRLMERGCKVSIVTRRYHSTWPASETLDGVKVQRLGVPGTGRIVTAVFTASLLLHIIVNRHSIDILHSHGAVNMGALCSWLGRWLGLKNVAKIASAGRIPKFSGSRVKRFILDSFQRSSAIISMTEEIDTELVAEATPPTAIQRITNGVDCKRFCKADTSTRSNWRQNQGLESDTKVVLFSSRLVFGKGLDILLGAWAEVSSRYPMVHLFILGDGTDQQDSIEQEMKTKVATESLERITFLGAVDNPEHYLGVADVFVFPSRQEGFPNALMEALAAGLAVVASDIGGVRPLIENNRTGILFATENSGDLAEKLNSLLADGAWGHSLGVEARNEMLNSYSFEKIADEYVKLYEKLVSGVVAPVQYLEQES